MFGLSWVALFVALLAVNVSNHAWAHGTPTGRAVCPTGTAHPAIHPGSTTAALHTTNGVPMQCQPVRQSWTVNLGVPGYGVGGPSGSGGTCSAGGHATRAACVGASETWTPTPARAASGIYEYNALITTAIPIILLITILWAGLMITRRVVRSFRGA